MPIDDRPHTSHGHCQFNGMSGRPPQEVLEVSRKLELGRKLLFRSNMIDGGYRIRPPQKRSARNPPNQDIHPRRHVVPVAKRGRSALGFAALDREWRDLVVR